MQLNIINTNARSLRPKIPSLIRSFVNLSLMLAIVTETWFAAGDRLELETENLLLGHGLRLQSLNRQPLPSGVAYGGVAVISREAYTKSTIFPFPNPSCFEVLPVSIVMLEIRRKLLVVAAYIPPNYPVPKAKLCLQHISDVVLEIKRRETDPLILVAGDFNQWNIGEALAEFSDMHELSTPPTRGDRNIDRVFCNWHDDIEEGGCISPLETEAIDGTSTSSDHRIQYFTARLPRREPAKRETFVHRPITAKGKLEFLAELETLDWSPVTSRDGPNAKVIALHAIFEDLTDRHFPLQEMTRREDDLPWIDKRARKTIKKKCAIFKAEGPSPRWEAVRNNLEAYLAKRREAFLEKQRLKFTGPNASAHFHQNVRAFSQAEKPKVFDVRDLCPGLDDRAVANEVAEYFNTISREFSPLAPSQIPMTYHRQLDLLSPDQVQKMLRDAKKPKSTVRGDIPPSLVNSAAHLLAVPVADVFNSIISTLVWPIAWKREFVTVIPKKPIPESFADLSPRARQSYPLASGGFRSRRQVQASLDLVTSCPSILGTGNLTRPEHCYDRQVESSFSIQWLVVHGRS